MDTNTVERNSENSVKLVNTQKVRKKNAKKEGGEKRMSQKDRKPGEKLIVSRVKRSRENAVITAAVGEVLSVMEKEHVSKSDLARTLGVSAPNVHQTLDPKRAMTLRTLARMAVALGREVQIRLITPKAA